MVKIDALIKRLKIKSANFHGRGASILLIVFLQGRVYTSKRGLDDFIIFPNFGNSIEL